MADDFIVRPYRPGDDERVRRLHGEAMRDAGAYVEDDPAFEAAIPDDVELEADLDAIEETYVEPGGAFAIGERDGEIVATGAFRLVDDATVEIKRMRVDPDHQRRGYGQRILDALEAEARARGFTELTLDTLARQTAARKFYEANGYEEGDRESFGGHEARFYRKSVEG